jgi:uncharacterized glyoxalase superfamily protein PhnB
MTSFKPAGFAAITPYLIVKDADRLLKFLIAAFDAREVEVHRDEENRIIHGQVIIEDSNLEFGQAGDTWPAFPASLHHYVADVEAVHARALMAGAQELDSPEDRPYGERGSAIKDPVGNQWFIATYTGKTFAKN